MGSQFCNSLILCVLISFHYTLGEQGDHLGPLFGDLDSDEDFLAGFYNLHLPSSPPVSESECGGYMHLANETELAYTNPGQSGGDSVTCVWIIRALNGGPVAVLLMDHNFSGPNGTMASLSLQNGLGQPNGTVSRPILAREKGKTIIHHFMASALVFKSSGGQGFSLMILDMGLTPHPTNRTISIQTIRRETDVLLKTFSHPPTEGMTYRSNEALLVMLQPFPGRILRLSIDFVDTEARYDSLTINKFSPTSNKFILLRGFTGHLGILKEALFEATDEEPIIIRFMTDGSAEFYGFKFTYSYELQGSEHLTSTTRSPGIISGGSSDSSSPCGGLLVLTRDISELSYTNLASTNNTNVDEETICIWTIWAAAGGPIGFRLVDQNFTTSTNVSPEGLLSLQNGFGSMESSSVARRIDMEATGLWLTQDYMASVLVFVSKKGQGFHLQFKSMGLATSNNSTARAVTIRRETGNNSNATRIYSHPSTPGTQYSSNEWWFVVLEPSRGHKIQVSVDYVDTETRHDFLKVFKFSRTSNNFVFLRKLTGHLGILEGFETFEGDDNQAMLVYFHTDGSVEGLGFRISYSYQELRTTSWTTSGPSIPLNYVSTCGGFVPLTTTRTAIAYRNGGSPDVEETCVWIVYSHSMSITFKDLGHNSTGPPPVISTYSGLKEYGNYSAPMRLRVGDKDTPFRYTGPILLVVNSRGNQSFALIIVDSTPKYGLGMSSTMLPINVFRREGDNVVRFSYPAGIGVRYSDNEQRYLIFEAAVGKVVSISIDYLDTEEVLDTLSIFKFVREEQQFVLLRQLSGHLGPLRSAITYYGDVNQPIILIFRTDSSAVFFGFRLSYSYILPGQMSTTIATTARVTQIPYMRTFRMPTLVPMTTKVPVYFVSCGGLVVLPNVTNLVYTNPGDDQNEKVCIWTIWASTGGPIGLTVSRMIPRGNFSYGSLTVQNGFASSDASSTSQSIATDGLRGEIIQNYVATVLVFVSRGGQGFELTPRGLAQSPAFTRWSKGYISLKKMESSDESVTFSYPPDGDGAHYENYDSQNIVIEAYPRKIIQVSVDFVHMEAHGDFLKVYRFSKKENKFIFLRKFSGPLGELQDAFFEGHENEPVLLYFFSDHSGSGEGFKISYSWVQAAHSSPSKSNLSQIESGVTKKGQLTPHVPADKGTGAEGNTTSWGVYMIVAVGIIVVAFGVIYTTFYAKRGSLTWPTTRFFSWTITSSRDVDLRPYPRHNSEQEQQQNTSTGTLDNLPLIIEAPRRPHIVS